MLRNILVYLFVLSLPTLSFAQTMDNLMVSNNSKSAISFKGDNGVCIAQSGSRTIHAISRADFAKLCKNTDCAVKIYSDYSCVTAEQFFNFNSEYGVSGFSAYISNPTIHVDGNHNYLFVTDRS
jgi:hypothetical protein